MAQIQKGPKVNVTITLIQSATRAVGVSSGGGGVASTLREPLWCQRPRITLMAFRIVVPNNASSGDVGALNPNRTAQSTRFVEDECSAVSLVGRTYITGLLTLISVVLSCVAVADMLNPFPLWLQYRLPVNSPFVTRNMLDR
jgi:hypothetical protein